MATSFSRSLGHEPGVQLNPTLDKSEGFAVNAVEDQTFAAVARLPRGPIDRAFEVHKGNVLRITGRPEPIRVNALNDAHTQLVEALNKGAKRAVISRLVGTDAKNKWIVVKKPDSPSGRYALKVELVDEVPSDTFILALKHHGCFNDGIRLSISAPELQDERSQSVDAKMITLKVMDKNKSVLDEFTGSIDLDSVDDDGYPNSLQAQIAKYAFDDYELVLAQGAVIPKDCAAYGKNENGIQRVQVTEVLYPFSEGSVSSFTALQYQSAVKQLKDTDSNFVYISSLGSNSTALCAALAQLGFDKNIQVMIDVPNHFTPKQAIAWVNQLGLSSHLLSLLWHPVECNDPNGVSGRVKIGTSAYRCALSCQRNAVQNALGFSAKQYAVAGRQFPIQRQGMKQLYKPDNEELSDLAAAGITPVIFQTFSSSSGYVFADAITKAGKETSFLNLISSVEIITSLERDVARIAREFLLFMPMEEAIKAAYRMIIQHFDAAKTSGWLVNSSELGGKAYELEIMPNQQRPADVMMVSWRVRPEGCVRQIHITSTITR
ncbi:hypothetical protein [Avibacterium paragallinarum]|uniref:Uncharacterized protein n=1 Tax=Avibacterium paragallinarum TaxID=728 RepID=A0AAE5TJV1_AVIPA|nr:hypothetical protein [Avibacterium paragallinarum]MEE3608301.1 hypothetical protein [Avibacterium paragallinarum]MEE3620776.1 hypothetical protein [Avibacterium paragallinarum]MEE3668077.1 hypothetical protein [Avibacterium paragallinarum]MEE3681349.1 hypothetical protein [Avibacterium paragallinarum]MEE4385881.1 hypothetical protein [Avibacterium paragallinarum]